MTKLQRVPSIFRNLSHFNDELSAFGTIISFDRIMDELLRAETPDFVEKFGPDFCKKGTYPKCDVTDSADSIKIEMDIPGLSKDQLSIELIDNDNKLFLNISGEARIEHDKDGTNYMIRELKKSAFKRSFLIDDTILDVDKIDAQFNNGVVILTLPKKHPEEIIKKNKKILIK